MASKSIKPIIHKNMENNYPEFEFDDNAKRYEIFRKRTIGGIYNFIHFQIDYKSNGITLNSAATYNKKWEGESTFPLGKDAGIENIKKHMRVVNARDGWYFSEKGFSNIDETIKTINIDIRKYILPYLEKSTMELQQDKLLQYCLESSKQYEINRDEFQDELKQCKFIIKDLRNPRYLSFLDKVNNYCLVNKIREIDSIERIICDIMYYGIKKDA